MNRVFNLFNRFPLATVIVSMILVFVFLLTILGYSFYSSIKTQTIQSYKNTVKMDIEQFDALLNRLLIVNDHNTIKKISQPLIDSNRFEKILVKYDRYIFNQETLVNNTNDDDIKKWAIDGVSVDARFGIIDTLPQKGWYEFLPIFKGQENLLVDVKYQAYDQTNVIGFFAQLNFSTIVLISNEPKEEIPFIFEPFVSFDLPEVSKRLSIDGIEYASINFVPDTNVVEQTLYDYLISLLILVFVLYFPIVILIIVYYQRWINNNVELPLQSINQYLENIEHNEYIKFDQEYTYGQMQILVKHIDALTGKIAKAINELNINKETLELKLTSDSVTGLANQERFELDTKRMFISSIPGYVFLIKIESLAEIAKNNSSFFTNNYIQEVAQSLKNITNSMRKFDLQLYRFHGSEFALVVKKAKDKDVKEIASTLIEQLQQNLPQKYLITENMINIGITPFDLYGTIDSIMKLAQDAYLLSKEKGMNSFHLIDFEPFQLEYDRLEDEINHIIENKDFEIGFSLETYLIEDKEKLLMKEVAPQLLNHKGEKLAIGSFISIAEKLHQAVAFDQINIEKSLEYLKINHAQYEIVVNLSIETLLNNDFIKWLGNILKSYDEYRHQLVFSITSYSASLHKVRFRSFVQRVHPLGVKILLKRYDLIEYPLKDLEDIPINYIRMKSDFTLNMAHDTFKKHKVKNTIIYAQLNDIEVLADSIQYEDDLKFLNRLGVYGASH